ncbi:MAG TPA: hypothetical protein DCK95_11760 [Anaerolineaceae bacterium]|jgi:hypothetical protein|nr:hypothetical protein [Anaerolineaceae bacterium]
MKNNSEPKLRVVIPTFNRADDLYDCLKSLENAGIQREQIIVVDNNSQDKTKKRIEQFFPEITLIALNKNMGATGASNIGFKQALDQGVDFVLRLDSDTVVAAELMDILLTYTNADPRIGILTPKIYYYEPPDEIWYAGADAHPWHFGSIHGHRHEKDAPQNSQPKEVDYAWGAAMLIKAEALQKTGGFDNDFFVYYEEVDFCKRVQNFGYKIWYVPDAKVWHKVGSSANNAWTAYHWNRSKMLLYRKHAKNDLHRLLLILYAFAYALFSPIIKGKSGNRGPLKETFEGLVDGLKNMENEDH